MRTQTLLCSYGCLLHDFGKIVYRAGGRSGSHSQLGFEALKELLPDKEWKEVLDCLRWHHASEIRKANIPQDHIAYIAYIADNLSAAADRREVEGESGSFVRDMALRPIFSHMNGEHRGYSLQPYPQDGRLRMPVNEKTPVPCARYADAEREIKEGLKGTGPEEQRLNSLLSLLESYTASFPSSTFTGESPDISIYDHLKTTAAIGACISEYLLSKGENEYKTLLFDREKEFRSEKAFILYSADLSGIQKFIYTVADSKALRSLRSRSFFLGLVMEHYVDELISACGLSRANLLYSGGGHCYILLPNTEETIKTIEAWNLKFNDFLLEEFGTGLFLAHGYTECSGNELINYPAEETPYKEMFRRVSSAISAHKLHRYSVSQILRLNSKKSGGERECKICGRSDCLKNDLCSWCRCFAELSYKIQNKEVYVVSKSPDETYDFCLPSFEAEAYFSFTDETAARKRLASGEEILRVYTKNKSCTGMRYSTRINVGDYAASNSMEELAGESNGIKRIAVCRMDVDNLGQSFVRGFEKAEAAEEKEKYHYVTISRTSAFSRQLSLFFQLYINDILSGSYGNKKALAVSIVYSGGDDVFLVGAWNDVLEAARRIQSALNEFSCGSLTISGGLGFFDDHFPIRAAAAVAAELEDRAKKQPGKNALSLFDPRQKHTYSWEVFDREIMGNKLRTLEKFFDEFEERGNSFLYNLVELLRAEEEINLARYAYQLARLEPKHSDPRWRNYREFADKMYAWAWNKKDREELITAIYIYVYLNREV